MNCRKGLIFIDFLRMGEICGILNSPEPSQYGPRGLGGRRDGRDLAEFVAGVESMADDARADGNRDQPPADEAALSARFQRLGERLGQIRSDRPPDSNDGRARPDTSGFARGFRLSSELVAGVLIGAAIGWLLDRWLGISPWGMIVFLLLGFAAGVLNVMRAAGVVASPRVDPPSSEQ